MEAPPDAPRFSPGLHWGICGRFVAYIAGMADGACSASDGANFDEDSLFHFALSVTNGDVNMGKPDVTVRCEGDVRFSGHFGFLYVRIANPLVEIRGTAGTLSVLASQEGPNYDSPFMPLVNFHAEVFGKPTRIVGTDVQLRPEGVELFNEVYEVGWPFDDFVLYLDSA